MRIWTTILLSLLLSACGTSHDKTGEAVLVDTGKLKIKVVQIYDDMPWHYYGLVHELWCQSPKTMDKALVRVEKGWDVISPQILSEPGQSPSAATKKKALDAASQEARKHLQIISDEIIAYENRGILTMSINGCQNFLVWNGWDLPEEKVIQSEKKQCPKDLKCPWENFNGENQITYSEIKADAASKTVSFRAHSKAFKNGDLLVRSEDGGRHWIETKAKLN